METGGLVLVLTLVIMRLMWLVDSLAIQVPTPTLLDRWGEL